MAKSFSLNNLLAIFGPPSFLHMPAGALDMSDHSIKYMSAERLSFDEFMPDFVKRIPLKSGVIEDGEIHSYDTLESTLKKLRKETHFDFVHIALPEELAYVFDLVIGKSEFKDKSVRQVIEFKLNEYVPVDPQTLVFDFDTIREDENEIYVGVTAFSRELVEEYVNIVESAGFMVKSAELETVSMSRAVTEREFLDKPVMVIDLGNSKAGLAVLIKNVPIFSTTIKFDLASVMDKLYRAASKEASFASEDEWKFKKGLLDVEGDNAEELFAELASEIKRYMHYWRTHKKDFLPEISRVYLCGGNASVKGMDAFFSLLLGTDVKFGSVWANMFNIERQLPNIDRQESYMYATVAGLLLKDKL